MDSARPPAPTVRWVPTEVEVKNSADDPIVVTIDAAGSDASDALLGALTEPPPASDTASSGLNGRLQRLAQRLSSIIALLPASIGTKTSAGSLSVVVASDQNAVPVTNASLPLPTGAAAEATQVAGNTLLGSVTESAPASDVASSGLNGRLQRIAQRVTSLIALLPVSLGQKTSAASLAVTVASDQTAVAVTLASVTPGTAAALLGKAEDAVAASGDTGVAMWGVRNDALAVLTSGDGDYSACAVDGRGAALTNSAIYTAAHLAAAATTTVKSGAGYLHSIIVNSKGTVASTITVYDNTAGSGTVIAIIDSLGLSGAFTYDIAFTTGLTLVVTGTVAPDVTVSYR